MKVISFAVVGLVALTCMGCGSDALSEPNASKPPVSAPASPQSPPVAALPAISDELYRRITVGTLPPTATAETIQVQEKHVRQWVSTIGGDVWYQNYRKGFAPPSVTNQLYIADNGPFDSPELGYYYLHHPATSGENLTVYPCAPANATSTITIRGLCSLANWNAYTLTSDDAYREAFLANARWFLANQVDGQWRWDIDVPSRELKAPWISGLSQSLGISVLLRAYQTTGDTAYLDAARDAFSWMTKPLADGGLAVATAGGTFIEEYPHATAPSHVLNGHMWALFGVWDYYRVTRDPEALALFQAGITAIKAEKDWYDVGHWATYDHRNRISMVTGMYMQFIVQQLLALGTITNDSFFTDLGKKWRNYQDTEALFVHIGVTEFTAAAQKK